MNRYPEKTGLLAWDEAVRAAQREYDQAEFDLASVNGGFVGGDPDAIRARMNSAAYKIRQATRQGWDFISDEPRTMRGHSSNAMLDTVVSNTVPGMFAIHGLACVYNQPFDYPDDDGTVRKIVVDRGAFDDIDNADVVLRLGGHTDNDPVIASTRDDTLFLTTDDLGLYFAGFVSFDEDIITRARQMADCSWHGEVIAYRDADGTEHWSTVRLNDGDVCLTPKGRNSLTAFGGSDAQMRANRMAKIDAELRQYGI